jgi:hypothetical protein
MIAWALYLDVKETMANGFPPKVSESANADKTMAMEKAMEIVHYKICQNI